MPVGAARRLLTGLCAALVCAAAPGSRADEVGDLEGFGDDEFSDDFEVDVDEPSAPQRWWDLDGSVAVSSSWNYLSHRSPPTAPPPNGVSWTGLSRLRTRLNLQLDLELPHDFELRVSPYIWYDFTYLIRGISRYTQQVIDKYEWEGDFQDSYIQGPLLDDLDIRIGRQVVNWGRSDSLRVLDILNPLDNREPGRADIEDLRWAVGMAKLDWYVGRWTLTGVAIPEMRFDDLPAFGNDFNPLPVRSPPTRKPNSFRDWEFAGRIGAIFEGWDFSVQYAWYFDDLPRLRSDLRLHHDRLMQAGAGANYTVGSWLFKGEAAWLDGFRFTSFEPGVGLETSDKKSRFDAMLGVEYYGISETTVAVEIVNRYIFDYDGLVLGFPAFLRENSTTYAIRYTADWMNQRLRTTVLALLFGYKVQDGVVLRFQGDYTIRDGLVLTAGMLIFKSGDLPPLDTWGSNDRVFVDIKWSF